MLLTPIFKRLVQDRITVLDNNITYQVRQIELLGTRVEDYKKKMLDDTSEATLLKEFLVTLNTIPDDILDT